MKTFKLWGVGATVSLLCLLASSLVSEAGTLTAGKTHIGTFEGTTTFTTSSSNGINPGLFIEVRDADGNLKQYESEEGIITVENTKEGAYVTQAKLLGKTKYVDQDSGEILDQWEAGRNLKLESVQMPVLTTTGKNLFDGNLISGYYEDGTLSKIIGDNANLYKTIKLNLKKGTYTFSFEESVRFIRQLKDGVYGVLGGDFTKFTTTLQTDGIYVLSFRKTDNTDFDLTKIQIEEGAQATSYEPFKSNILSASEDLELRGIGGVRDELDCLSGEVVKNTEKFVLDGTQSNIVKSSAYSNESYSTFSFNDFIPIIGDVRNIDILCDKLPNIKEIGSQVPNQEGISYISNGYGIRISILNSRLETTDINGLNKYLSKNPISFVCPIVEKSIKTVGLNATYEFNLVSDSVVKVHGDILPTIYSITVPSEPLTFTINPNAETGKQFIAPEFEITNESPGPIQLELKAFEQVTPLFNDVLPDEHEDWSQLNKKESKDIALALVPKPSDAWLTLNEGPKYVANSANTLLGEIRKDATVEFSFSAYHGGVFEPNLSPEYRLVFTFGF